jgi:hypothetical protein
MWANLASLQQQSQNWLNFAFVLLGNNWCYCPSIK